MKTPLAWALPACTLLLAGAAVQAQTTIYRVIGPNNQVILTDRPPANVQQATAVRPSGKPLPTSDATLPYELRQVVEKYPVTLYSGNGCAPCNLGRQLLQSRGVPFTELTVTTPEDAEALQRIGGDRSLPLLTIGAQKIKGFSEAEWTQFLTAANYPARSLLSSSYRAPAPRPLVVVQRPEAAQPAAPAAVEREPEQAAAPAQPSEPPPRNPSGIQF